MPLAEPTPRDSRFGSPLKLSKVHWVRPEVVVEVTYLTWTDDNLLRQVSYQGQRQDKPAPEVVRPVPPSASTRSLKEVEAPPGGGHGRRLTSHGNSRLWGRVEALTQRCPTARVAGLS